MLQLILRSFASLFYLFIMTKLLGRRQISQLTFFDYVIGISMGSIAAEMTINSDIVYHTGFLSMAIYTFVAIIFNYVTLKSNVARKIINGRPILLMEDGKIIKKNLKKGRIEVNDLLKEARYNGFFNLKDIAFAILENSGRISFLPFDSSRPLMLSDIKITLNKTNLPISIIIDGKILYDSLNNLGKKEDWIYSKLNEKSLLLDNVILALAYGNEIHFFEN